MSNPDSRILRLRIVAAITIAATAPVFLISAAIAADSEKGKATYQAACAVCHAAAVAGAPKLGDKATWAPRIAAGNAVLYEHALKGFQGKTGAMPPKGGNSGLKDDDVKAAVDYMVNSAR